MSRSTSFRIVSIGIGTRGPEMSPWVMMSTPASIAMSRLSTEVVCVWTVMPARCPSSTITRCTRSEKEMKYISTWLLDPYLRKSTPVPVYSRIAERTESGVIHMRPRPVPRSHVSFVRFTKALLTWAAASLRKSRESGPSKPMMLPAK